RHSAELVDLLKQLAVDSRQLSRLTAIDELVRSLPEDAGFALGDRLADTLAEIPARYAPECMSTCELAFACRDEARSQGCVDVLGRTVCDELGGLDNIDVVLSLAEGSLDLGEEYADITEVLRQAHRLRLEVAG